MVLSQTHGGEVDSSEDVKSGSMSALASAASTPRENKPLKKIACVRGGVTHVKGRAHVTHEYEFVPTTTFDTLDCTACDANQTVLVAVQRQLSSSTTTPAALLSACACSCTSRGPLVPTLVLRHHQCSALPNVAPLASKVRQ